MKIFILFSAGFVLISCASNPSSNLISKDFSSFENAKILSDLKQTWGNPSKQSKIILQNKHLEQFEYLSQNNEILKRFLVDSSGTIIEKVYFPQKDSDLSNLQNLMASTFKNFEFQKIPVKCRHFSEVVYVDKIKGVILISREVANAKVDGIVLASPKMVELRIEENASRTCSYSH